jgi:hypothetical protein
LLSSESKWALRDLLTQVPPARFVPQVDPSLSLQKHVISIFTPQHQPRSREIQDIRLYKCGFGTRFGTPPFAMCNRILKKGVLGGDLILWREEGSGNRGEAQGIFPSPSFFRRATKQIERAFGADWVVFVMLWREMEVEVEVEGSGKRPPAQGKGEFR